MVKVRATKASRIYNKAFKEFHRIVEEGEEFEITEERYDFLHGGNQFNIIFVEKVEEKKEKVKIDPPVKEEQPEIFVIEPGEEPVKVDEELKPVKKTKPKTTKKKKVENES